MTKEELRKHQKACMESKKNNPWTIKEIELLTELVENKIDSYKYIYNQKFFPKRTMNAIRMKISSLNGRV